MMTSLMSIFDPSPYQSFFLGVGVYWFSCFFFFFFPSSYFWMQKSSFLFFLKSFFFYLFYSFKSKNFLIILSIFFFILFFNLSGLLPFSFCVTSQFFFHFFFGSIVWLGAIFFFFKKNLNSFLSHFTPQGSPLSFSFLLIPIEIVSTLIRPFALSLRLMANMVAGHMILVLLEGGIWSLFFFPSWVCCFFFTTFEIGVSIIQSYVFCNLLYLYNKESNLD